MEPFQLLCPGCASKLKVRNRSAIGQRLACPKCREMILVEAPEGFDVAETNAGLASFDNMDLDSLLENRPPVAAKPSAKSSAKPSAKSSAKPPAQSSTTAPRPRTQQKPQKPTASDSLPPPLGLPPRQELAPGEKWVNPATKKKQRVVLLVMAAVGSLLAIGAVTVFLTTWLGSGEDKIAEAPSIDEVDVKEDVTEPDLPVAPVATPDAVAKEETEVAPDPTPVLEPAEDPVAVPDIGDAPMIAGIPDTAPSIPGTEPSTADAPEGFGDTPTNEATTEVTTSDKPETEVDQLSSILAESGTSILEIQNAASIVRNNFAIGTPKYFFEKVAFEPTDSNRAKSQILLEVKYDQQPLQTVLHELAAISGLQLTIDVPSIAATDGDFNPKVDLQIENESTGSIVRKIADSVGLEAIESDHGFWITAKVDDDFVQESIGVALIVEKPEDGLELVRLVSQLVYPGTWKTSAAEPDADPNQPKGTIELSDGKLQLNHSPAVIRETQKLIDGIKAASRNDTSASDLLQPVPWIDAGSFTKPVEAMNEVRVTIGDFFRGFRDKHEIQMMADWHSLAISGWTSDAMAPGQIEERTVGDIVKETAHGMGSAFYVVDDKTVWVSSPEYVSNIFLLKLYPVDKVANGRLTKQRLARILSDSLGNQIGQPGVSFFVLPTQKLVAVRAPQSLHRQLEAVFSAIK